MTRESYAANRGVNFQRSSLLEYFEARLFNILKNPTDFNRLLYELLPSRPNWTIDQGDDGRYFLKFFNAESSHSSDGMGEGIISLFVILDALHDSKPGQIIAIDEPELSLHPSLQKKLAEMFFRYSSDRQLVLSTHSPYFISIDSLKNGGELVRVITQNGATKINRLSAANREALVSLAFGNINNPHIFGLDAKEVFFQEDAIIIVEGQEDVVLYPSVSAQIGITVQGSFYGWGAGGAGNIGCLCRILRDLGFVKVVAILDADKAAEITKLESEFSDFRFLVIPADDVRTKRPRTPSYLKEGLLDINGILKETYKAAVVTVWTEINNYIATEK